MNDLQKMAQEKSVLQWGGLAGILGSITLIVVFGIVGVFAGMGPVDVMRFPDIRTALIVGDSLYLVVLILWVIHFLALYRALRETSLAPALFGSALGILGLVVLAAESLHQPWQKPISDLYHAPGATLEAADIVLRSTFIKGIPVVDGQGRLVGTITHAHLAAHRFASVDRVRPETGSTPTARTQRTDQPTDRRGLDQGA